MNKIREETINCIIKGSGFTLPSELVSQSLEEDGWTVHPVFFQDKLIGGIIEKEGSIHTSIVPEYQKKWNPRPYIKSILYPALLKYKILYSDALKNDSRAIRWLTKLGFIFLKSDSERIYFQLKNLKPRYLNVLEFN